MPGKKKYKKKRGKKKVTFERGGLARAKRDVLARRLAASRAGVEVPFGLATYMVRAGVKVANGEVARELREQTAMARK